METIISYIVVVIIGFAIGEWNSRRRRNAHLDTIDELAHYSPRTEIIVQGKHQDIIEFNSSIRKYQMEHSHNPRLDAIVCASDGRLTIAFFWEEEIKQKS